MTKAAYHPTNRQPLATDVDYARMDAILAKHAKRNDDRASSGYPESSGTAELIPPELRPAPVPLEWEPREERRGYYTLCKRYSVCSVTVAGHDFYQAHKRASDGWCYFALDGNPKSFDEAEALAQADANKVRP